MRGFELGEVGGGQPLGEGGRASEAPGVNAARPGYEAGAGVGKDMGEQAL